MDPDDLTQTFDSALRAALPRIIADELKNHARGVDSSQRPNVQLSVTASEDDKKIAAGGGFRSAGHFAHTVYRGMNPGNPDGESVTLLRDWHGLVARAVTGMSAGSDPEGGLLVPPGYTAQIWDKTRDHENLANRIGLLPVTGNGMTIPANAENSRANGSRFGGVQSFWKAEAAQLTGSKPTFRSLELKLKKLTCLITTTNELLEDAAALEAYINRVAPAEIAFRVNDGLINGGGAGELMGVLAAPATITVAAVGSQGANTIVAQNISDMWARMYGPSRRNAVWMYNQDIESQLDGLKYATGSSSGQLVYMPPSGLSGAGYSTIKGRPAFPIEQAQTLGTRGDLILCDWTQYVGIQKGIKGEMSLHIRFDYDESMFRFVLRLDAQPYWSEPLTPFKGTATQSPFVVLNSTRT